MGRLTVIIIKKSMEKIERAKIERALQHTVQVLKQDVFFFRQVILQSEGGNLPTEIIEKQNLIKEIEEAILAINQYSVNAEST